MNMLPITGKNTNDAKYRNSVNIKKQITAGIKRIAVFIVFGISCTRIL